MGASQFIPILKNLATVLVGAGSPKSLLFTKILNNPPRILLHNFRELVLVGANGIRPPYIALRSKIVLGISVESVVFPELNLTAEQIFTGG
ncbi:hypothetical protein BCD67_00435 [Oscillatoriales cyanobacterium USR001]|nr:hypothetical protein BCD67_00435 [Oscillatoriales cyanobacterium USR001]